MNTKKNFTIVIVLGAVITGIIGFAGLLATPVMRADTHPAVNVLSPVSIAFGQTLRVTFSNVGRNPLEIIPCIFDGDGEHLKTGALIRLLPGQMRSFDIGRSEIPGRTEPSVTVRAGVHADRSNLTHLIVGGEVIDDASGKSSVYVSGPNNPREPAQGGRVTSSLAPVGIVSGQTARVIFLNMGRNPLEIVPCVFDGDGEHLKEGPAMTLEPGQMRSLEISWEEASAGRTETRIQMRGAAHVDGGDEKNLVISGEVVENATGKSSLYVPPGARNGFDPQPDPPASLEQ
jgi:hypothetical protein